jgi:ATP-dependent DNA helicase RecG
MRMHYRARRAQAAPPLAPRGDLVARLLARLPFKLTRAQVRAWGEIERDLVAAHPMNRLLQGDVGSGKTVVAAAAAVRAVEGGWQAAVMAPTEILAEQHHRKFAEWLAPLGLKVAWLAGALPARERRAAIAAVAAGEIQVAVGTHALFQEKVEFARLGLAIVDEQHRFGVRQRLALREKGKRSSRPLAKGAAKRRVAEDPSDLIPHQLMMSATPIPRTLSMSYYADLDVSVIDELPPGRKPVITKLVAGSRRDEVVRRIHDACGEGRQAYWVCPLIEESEALELKTALETHARLAAELPGLAVGLVHGRLPQAEKAAVMEAFKAGRIQLLVATTVIEVGVDVPNASLMVVEHAERFGLSQLHQLRGRVGRGADESVCILLYEHPLSDGARTRLKVIYEHTDGFRIAHEDMLLRGPGEYLGARQSGVPLLRFADLVQDEDLVQAARATAELMLDRYPAAATAHVARWLGGRMELMAV